MNREEILELLKTCDLYGQIKRGDGPTAVYLFNQNGGRPYRLRCKKNRVIVKGKFFWNRRYRFTLDELRSGWEKGKDILPK